MIGKQIIPKLKQLYKISPVNGTKILQQRLYFRPSKHFPIWRVYGKHFDNMFRDHSQLVKENLGKNMEQMIEDTIQRCSRPFVQPIFQRCKEVEVTHIANKYEIKMAMDKFSPEDIKIKLVDGTKVITNAKHEEKEDPHGYVSREVTRQFTLPEHVKQDTLESLFMEDGYLILRAKTETNQNERVLHIKRETARKDTRDRGENVAETEE